MLYNLKKSHIVFFVVYCSLICFKVYPQNKQVCTISEIKISGNEITKNSIILRELEFNKQDSLNIADVQNIMAKAEQNLLNTLLFNFVSVKPVWGVDSSNVRVLIDVLEKWYIWPIPLFEIADRNFNSWWENKDFSRLNYGLFLKWFNFTGRNDLLKVLLRFGVESKFGLFYEIPSINKKQNLGIYFGVNYANFHEIGVESIDNKLIYYKDDQSYPFKKIETYFRLSFRPKIHKEQFLEIKYQDSHFSESLVVKYPKVTQNSLSELNFLSLTYKFINDHRDYIPYPLKGYYFDFELNKIGLNLLNPHGVDFLYLKSDFNLYWHLKNSWFYAIGMKTKISNAKFQPYILQRGLGYEIDYIRGYELFVLDGQNYGLVKSNLKFELAPKRTYYLKFIRNEKFSKLFYALYLNLFFDIAYVNDKYNAALNPLVNDFQYSIGMGFDYVTFYNLVFRAEYSINRQKRNFLFFHMKAPI